MMKSSKTPSKSFVLPKKGSFSIGNKGRAEDRASHFLLHNDKVIKEFFHTKQPSSALQQQSDYHNNEIITWGLAENENPFVTTHARTYTDLSPQREKTSQNFATHKEKLTASLIPCETYEPKRQLKAVPPPRTNEVEVKTFFDKFGHNERPDPSGKKHYNQVLLTSHTNTESMDYRYYKNPNERTPPKTIAKMIKTVYDHQNQTSPGEKDQASIAKNDVIQSAIEKQNLAGASFINKRLNTEKTSTASKTPTSASKKNISHNILEHKEDLIDSGKKPPKAQAESTRQKLPEPLKQKALLMQEAQERKQAEKFKNWARRNKSIHFDRDLDFSIEDSDSRLNQTMFTGRDKFLSTKEKSASIKDFTTTSKEYSRPDRAHSSNQLLVKADNPAIEPHRCQTNPKEALVNLRKATKSHENLVHMLRSDFKEPAGPRFVAAHVVAPRSSFIK